MNIHLIEKTSLKPLKVACSMPYRSQQDEEIVKRVFDLGHRSIARHSNISFLVEGVSVSLLTQISRHSNINLTVESSRYCDMSSKDCVIPPFLKKEDKGRFLTDYKLIMDIVRRYADDTNYTTKERKHLSKLFLPKNSTLNLVVSGNYQAIYEFLQLRICKRSEWEIRGLARKMADLLVEEVPLLFEGFGCKGSTGECKEKDCD